jgi:hypothetical protein
MAWSPTKAFGDGIANLTTKLRAMIHTSAEITIVIDLTNFRLDGSPIPILHHPGKRTANPLTARVHPALLHVPSLLDPPAKVGAYVVLFCRTHLSCGLAKNGTEVKASEVSWNGGNHSTLVMPDCTVSKETVLWRLVPAVDQKMGSFGGLEPQFVAIVRCTCNKNQ